MCINFQQNPVCRSVKTVHTNLFAINRKLHIFATTNSKFEKKNDYFRYTSSETYMYINFSKLGLVDQSKPCAQIYLQKIASCINLQLY